MPRSSSRNEEAIGWFEEASLASEMIHLSLSPHYQASSRLLYLLAMVVCAKEKRWLSR